MAKKNAAAFIPPHSIEAEQSVLGGMLIDNEAAEDVLGLLHAEDFYRADHKILFSTIQTLFSERRPVDIITVSEHLERLNSLKEAGGTVYIGELAQNTPTAANIKTYAIIVRERALMRALIQIGADISRMGFDPQGLGPMELTEKAEQMVFKLAEQQIKTDSFKPIEKVFGEVIQRVSDLSELDSDITGVPSGFVDLDKMTAGFQSGDLIILAGRPSMGKTTLAMNLVEHAARHYMKPAFIEGGDSMPSCVGVFSMEMGAEQVVMRLASSIGKIPLSNLRNGQLDHDQWQQFFSAGETIKPLQIHIDDSSGLTAFELRARARRLKRNYNNLSLIIVDYLQLLHGDSKEDNRVAEMTQISRLLKEMARELNIPVVALSQLNRGLEKRNDRRPIMSDLRESGSIEQDADIIMFIHREEVYEKNKPELKGQAKLIIAKQRNGDIGDINLRFEGQYSRFTTPVHRDAEEHLAYDGFHVDDLQQ